MEPRIFVSDFNRIYVFFVGGKLECDFHLMDLMEIESASKSQLTLKWETKTVEYGKIISSGKSYTISISPVSHATYDMDVIIWWINKQWLNLTLPPKLKFKQIILPLHRQESIIGRIQSEDPESGCGGLVQTYISICDWLDYEVDESILWDLELYFYPNQKREFYLYDLIKKDKWPNPEFQSLVFALHNNSWFHTFNSSGCSLGNDSLVILSEMMRENVSITELSITDGGASKNGIVALSEALASNNEVSLKILDLSGNVFDHKSLTVFTSSLTTNALNKLRCLNISNSKIPKVGVLLEAILTTPSLLQCLEKLNISQNKLESQCSKTLGTLLVTSHRLLNLNISGTNTVWMSLVEGLSEKAIISLVEIDISNNHPKNKQFAELVAFLNAIVHLKSIILSNTQISAQNLYSILKKAKYLEYLDISDNIELMDGDIKILMRGLVDKEFSTNLKVLHMNNVFTKKSKKRSAAMKETANAINLSGIKEFSISGCKLKTDILDFLFGLFNNKTLEVLNISGNQSGDSMAFVLSKLLQHNATIHTIYWDGNETTLTGLKSILLGLKRNRAIKTFPLPLFDLANLIKKENVDTQAVEQITKEIQSNITEKLKTTLVGGSAVRDYTVNSDLPFAKRRSIKNLQRATSEKRNSVKQLPHFSKKKQPVKLVSQNVDIVRAAKLWGVKTDNEENINASSEKSSDSSNSNEEQEDGEENKDTKEDTEPPTDSENTNTTEKMEEEPRRPKRIIRKQQNTTTQLPPHAITPPPYHYDPHSVPNTDPHRSSVSHKAKLSLSTRYKKEPQSPLHLESAPIIDKSSLKFAHSALVSAPALPQLNIDAPPSPLLKPLDYDLKYPSSQELMHSGADLERKKKREKLKEKRAKSAGKSKENIKNPNSAKKLRSTIEMDTTGANHMQELVDVGVEQDEEEHEIKEEEKLVAEEDPKFTKKANSKHKLKSHGESEKNEAKEKKRLKPEITTHKKTKSNQD
uniref:Uncharacterized protein n=1 Tax=Arcella intermedia TaxID=1963864 RepID=A0A6B2KX85_9EUKA